MEKMAMEKPMMQKKEMRPMMKGKAPKDADMPCKMMKREKK